MFDDQKVPSNLPTGKEPSYAKASDGEPDDIFKDVEPAKPVFQAQPLKSSAPIAPPVSSLTEPARETEIKQPLIASKKVIIVLGLILGILVVVGVVFSAIRFVKNSAQNQQIEPTAESNITNDVQALPELPAGNQGDTIGLPSLTDDGATNTQQAETAILDTDGDGLTDTEEMDLGTDIQNPDSDNDGLFDGEEAQTYKTDPLNPDTDKDTFLDGQEVSNNYNPKGEGRLLEIPAQ